MAKNLKSFYLVVENINDEISITAHYVVSSSDDADLRKVKALVVTLDSSLMEKAEDVFDAAEVVVKLDESIS